MTALVRPGRIVGLDAWRAALMLFGIALHASAWQVERPAFAAIGLISSSFRMGCFFTISGVLSGLILDRRPGREWFRHRIIQLGIPMMFGLAVICPITGLITASINHVPLRTAMFNWYHLWFLMALLFYAALGAVAYRMERRFGLQERVARRCASREPLQLPLILITAASSFLLMALVSVVLVDVVPDWAMPVTVQLRPTIGYVPVFAMGFAIGRSSCLREAVLAGWRLPAGIVAVATLSFALAWYSLQHGGEVDVLGFDMLRLVAAALCPPAASILILRSAFAIRSVPPLLMRLSKASFTMYMVHFPIVAGVSALFLSARWNGYAGYVAVVAISGTLSYLCHSLLVTRSPLLALLLNGCLPRGAELFPQARLALARVPVRRRRPS